MHFSTDALIKAASGQFVYVVGTPEKQGELPTARRVPVDVQFERGERAYVAVASGVFTVGDRVIVEGNERLIPGLSLMVKSRGATTAGFAP